MPPPSIDASTTDRHADRRLVLSGFLFGCGIAGSVIDLFVFHLLLQWHHFYDLSTPNVALLADGLFHGATWLITVWGLFMLGDVRQRMVVPWWRWSGAVLTGVGVFQLFDGIVFHKVLRIHQIRYGVDLMVYDVVWIGSAVLLLLIGRLILWRTPSPRERKPASPQTRE
ncbi:putative membrane protein [Dietzia sp. 2505]|uniref:DUF2243 domain-containing protein n=1 Tax=Dietzia sp. 2505 TaxID=3156457 RepID=UPI003392D43B